MDRKFHIANYSICYQEPYSGFFTSRPGKYYNILFYEENGVYFEFLTGKLFGTRCNGSCGKDGVYEYLYSEEFNKTFYLRSTYSYFNPEVYALSAKEFSERAQKYLEDKNEIIPHLNKQFDEWRENAEANRKAMEEREKKAELKQRAEKDAANWLDDFINNRK